MLESVTDATGLCFPRISTQIPLARSTTTVHEERVPNVTDNAPNLPVRGPWERGTCHLGVRSELLPRRPSVQERTSRWGDRRPRRGERPFSRGDRRHPVRERSPQREGRLPPVRVRSPKREVRPPLVRERSPSGRGVVTR
jgi:hypothetical protein